MFACIGIVLTISIIPTYQHSIFFASLLLMSAGIPTQFSGKKKIYKWLQRFRQRSGKVSCVFQPAHRWIVTKSVVQSLVKVQRISVAMVTCVYMSAGTTVAVILAYIKFKATRIVNALFSWHVSIIRSLQGRTWDWSNLQFRWLLVECLMCQASTAVRRRKRLDTLYCVVHVSHRHAANIWRWISRTGLLEIESPVHVIFLLSVWRVNHSTQRRKETGNFS